MTNILQGDLTKRNTLSYYRCNNDNAKEPFTKRYTYVPNLALSFNACYNSIQTCSEVCPTNTIKYTTKSKLDKIENTTEG